MSSDLDARIKVGADTRDAEAGIDRVNEKVASMGDVASKAGAKASTALDGMGRSSDEAATKFARGEAAMASAMRRVSEQMEIAVRQGKSLADAFQIKAEIRGFDASKFDPILDRMRQLESQLSVAKAAEEDFAAQNAFAKKHQQATELNKAAQYTSWWAAELDKVEAAERKLASENAFISSLKAQSDAIGKTRADLLEMQAAQMGVASQAAPFIAKMREAETGMAGAGMSAKAMSAAMRGVPAQISDIVVSLQGGMPVMTVFMQQGFQLRDMFGGFGPAAKALGSTLLELVSPYTVAAAGVAALGATMLHTESTLRTHMALMNQLEATGRAGFLNADAVKQLKNDMAELPGISRSTASAIISDLVQVRTLGGEALQKIALMSADFAAATGQDAAGAAKELAKAMEEPDKAARALDEAFNFLTLEQLIAIDAMVEAGDKAGAQKMLLDALGQSLSGTAEKQTEMQKASKELSNAWDDLMQSMAPSVETMNAVSAGLANVVRGINGITEAVPRANEVITKWLPGMQAMMGPLGMWARIKGLKAIEDEASAAVNSAANTVPVGGGAGRGSINPPLVGTTGVKSDADKDLSDLLDTTKAFKAKKDAIEDLNKTLGRLQVQQQRLRDEGRGDSKEADELQSRIDGVNEKIKSLSKTRGDSSKKEQTAYSELAASIKAKIDVNKAEIENSAKLNEAQKAEIKLNADLKDKKITLSAAHEEDLRKRIEIWKQQEKDKEQAKRNVELYQQQLDIEKQVTEDYLRRSKALEAARQAMDAYEKSAQEDHDRLQLEAGLIGMSNQARAVALAQYDAELELKRKIAEIEKLDATNAQKDELIDRARMVSYQRITNAQIKASNDEWSKSYDQASQSLSDALMDGGRNGADYVAGLFRSLVLRPVIQAVVQPVAGGIADGVTSLLGLGGSGGNGVGSALSSLSGISKLSSLFGGGTTAGASITSLGYANAVGLAGGDAIGALAAANAQWAGVATGAQAAAQAAVAANAALEAGTAVALEAGTLATAGGAAGAGGLSAALGAIPGWGWALAGGALLLGSMDFGSRGANHTGGAYSTSTGDRNAAASQALGSDAWGNALGDITQRANTALDAQLGKTVDALSGVYTSLAKYAGSSAKQIDIAAAFAVNPSHSDEDNYGYFRLIDKIRGQALSTYKARDGVLGTDPKVAYEKFVGEMGGALIAQLKAADIPGWMRSIFDGLGSDITVDGLNKALTAIAAVDSAFKGWADTLKGFASLSAEAQTSLIKTSGGIDALAGNVNTFYGSFYSEQERMVTLQRQVLQQLASLDVSVDTSSAEAAKESFRKTVEGALDAGNAELAAKLLAMSGSFATAADYAAKAAEEAVQAASKAMESLLSDRRQLEAELLKAQGNTSGYAAAMRAIATEGYTPAEVAAYDYNAALRDQIDAMTAATAAAERAASERAGLETRLLNLQGDTAALRQRELAALDASNRALQEHIWAIEDAQAAYTAATTAAQGAYSGLERSVGAQKSVLQEQYNAQKAALQQQANAAKEAWQAQVSAAQTAASEMRSIASMLGNAFDAVQVQSPALSMARLQSAQSLIIGARDRNDVRVAGLDEALQVASGDTAKMYGKWEEWAFQQGVTAAAVGDLYGEAQKQLSAQEQLIAQLQASDVVAKAISDAEMAKTDAWYQQELGVLDATLKTGKDQLNALLGVDDRVLSVAEAVAKLGESITAAEAARSAADAAKTAAMQAAISAAKGGGGGGGSSGTGQFYTDAGGNKVELLAGQSMAYFQALSQSGTTAVSSLGELKDRLTALGKSDVWESFSNSLKLTKSDFTDSSVKHPLITDAAGNIIAVGGWQESDPIGWAKSQGALGATASGAGGALSGAQTWTYADIAKEVQTALAQGNSASQIISAGMSNYGVSAADIQAAVAQAGISGFAVDDIVKNIINGSHADGLSYVPFDGYIAELHKGERVMTADENRLYTPNFAAVNYGAGVIESLIAEIAKLHALLAEISANTNATAGWTAATDRKLNRVVRNDAIATITT